MRKAPCLNADQSNRQEATPTKRQRRAQIIIMCPQTKINIVRKRLKIRTHKPSIFNDLRKLPEEKELSHL